MSLDNQETPEQRAERLALIKQLTEMGHIVIEENARILIVKPVGQSVLRQARMPQCILVDAATEAMFGSVHGNLGKLASALAVSKATVSRWRSGEVAMTEEHREAIIRIANERGTPVSMDIVNTIRQCSDTPPILTAKPPANPTPLIASPSGTASTGNAKTLTLEDLL